MLSSQKLVLTAASSLPLPSLYEGLVKPLLSCSLRDQPFGSPTPPHTEKNLFVNKTLWKVSILHLFPGGTLTDQYHMPDPLFIQVKLGILKVSPSALSLECFQVWWINFLAGCRVGWLGTGCLAGTWSSLSQRWDKGYLGYIICSFLSLVNLSWCFANDNTEAWTVSGIRQSRLPYPRLGFQPPHL